MPYAVVGVIELPFTDAVATIQLPNDVQAIRLKTDAVCKVMAKAEEAPVLAELKETIVPGGPEPDRRVAGGAHVGVAHAAGDPPGTLEIILLS